MYVRIDGSTVGPLGAGGGGVGGSGTTGTIPKWSAGTTLADSIITESGASISVAGAFSASHTGSVITATGTGTGPVFYGIGNGNANGTYIQLQESGSKNWFIGMDDGGSTLNFREDSIGGNIALSLDASSNLVVGGALTAYTGTFTATGGDIILEVN